MCDEVLEQAMLYYIIYENYECDVTDADFTNSANKKIINVINKLKSKHEEISLLAIQSQFNGDTKALLHYLTTLNEYVLGTDADSVYYKLIELTQKRQTFELLTKKINEVNESNIDDLQTELIKSIENTRIRNSKEESFTDQVMKTTKEIENTYNKRDDYSLYTGITPLDDLTFGLHKQELTIIGARPRSWKNYTRITNSRAHRTQRT